MTSVPRVLPLFPLPNVVLFPQMPLPLQVFEPRYRKMVTDILEGHRTIGMTLLRPGWEADYHGRPAVYPMGCAGVMQQCEPVAGGRFHILLRGLTRFRIVEEHGGESYRVASVEPCPESMGEQAVIEVVRQRVLAMLGRTATVLVLQPDLPHDLFINALSQSMDLTPLEKQSLLDCDDILARYRRLAEILDFRLLEQSQNSQGRRPLRH